MIVSPSTFPAVGPASCRWALAAGLLLSLTGGCRKSDELAHVTGVLRIGQEPAANVLVIFIPEPARTTSAVRSVAVTNANGSFELRTDDGRVGVDVGPHRVILEDLNLYAHERTDKPPSAGAAEPVSRVPLAYRATGTTPLLPHVERGDQQFNLDVPVSGR